MNRPRFLSLCGVLVLPLLFLLSGCSHEIWPTANPQANITITSSTTSVVHGDSLQFTANVTGGATGQSPTVSWSSSDSSILTVSSAGLVSGVSAGTATLTASVGAVKATVTVTVTPVATGKVDSTGAKIQVSAANSPVHGVVVDVPADAVAAGDSVNIGIDYADALPGAVPNSGVAATKTIVLTKDIAYNFLVPVTVTVPVDPVSLANGDLPIVMYWSDTYKKYLPASLTAIDTANSTVSFETAHFSNFVATFIPAVAAKAQTTTIDTGFRPEVDGFFHPNFGSYEDPGGSSLGMALYSAWYFAEKKPTDTMGLYNKYREGDPNLWQDDVTARELISRAYASSSQIWKVVSRKANRPGPTDTATAIWTALLLTNSPQPLLLKGATWAHAVLVFGWDAATQRFQIYDSNFPGETVTLSWAAVNGFGSYTKAAAYPGTIQSFALEGIGVALEGAEFEPYYTGAENGWASSKFGTVTITTPTPDTTNLANVKDGNNVQIQGMVTGGVKTPTSLTYYLNGTKAGSVAITGGQFSFTITQLPRPTNNLMLVATTDKRDPWNAYGGFGEYTIQILGQNFFVNPSFETGDYTGWTHETHTWQNRAPGSFTPEKSVVASGADPYDANLVVQHGTYAARVNNDDDSYHISSVSQQVTVPTGVSTLQFYWAAVLEDPGHPASQQPYVEVVVVDNDAVAGVASQCPDLSTDGIHPPPPAGCLYYRYFYSNDPNYPGWLPFGYDWKVIEWQTAIVDVSSAVGHHITVKVEAADCAQGGHGGYAYFDADVQ